MDKALAEIQSKLKVPKNQRNSFGNYNYRSCEDILEAVKPLLGDSILTISDELVQVGDRYYIKATAKFNSIEVTAYAREEEIKKGMDGAQITGSASSYARKYALNGLFLIDDTKDSDATNTHDKDPNKTTSTVTEKVSGLSAIKSLPELTKLWETLSATQKASQKLDFTKRREELVAEAMNG